MLLTPYILGPTKLKNHVVMAPMTRSRAVKNVPNELMATYYSQRAGAGLIITEGISPSPNGLGYSRMPGIFSKEQVEGWKPVTRAVHRKEGKIFAQLMHAGRVGHSSNLPKAARILGPSAVTIPGQIWTDTDGMQPYGEASEMTLSEIAEVKREFVQAARNAKAAGFDGIELHGANGYLLEQFLSPHSNRRTDQYGGSIQNRTRLVLEIAREVSDEIGKERTGIRLSPYGLYNDMPHYAEIEATYTYLIRELDRIGVVYVHLIDTEGSLPLELKQSIRSVFNNTLILSGGYTHTKAADDLESGLGDLIAFGKPFIANPDFVERLHKRLPLNIKLDASTFFTPGPKGFTDYPVFEYEPVSI